MKRVHRKYYDRLDQLVARLELEFDDRSVQSTHVWRRDVRAIEWAAWWIREAIAEDLKLRKSA